MLEMLDQGLGDEKVICVGKNNPRYKDVWNFSEIYPHAPRDHPLLLYLQRPRGKAHHVKGWRDASFARTKVAEAQQNSLSKTK